MLERKHLLKLIMPSLKTCVSGYACLGKNIQSKLNMFHFVTRACVCVFKQLLSGISYFIWSLTRTGLVFFTFYLELELNASGISFLFRV